MAKEAAKKPFGGRGGSKPGERRGGRKPGVPNKVTQDFRATVAKVLGENSENVGKWLKSVADGDKAAGRAGDPGKALDLMAKLAEYAAPKLARTELVGDPDNPVHVAPSAMTDEALMALISKLGKNGSA
jgi:hypothetical protein